MTPDQNASPNLSRQHATKVPYSERQGTQRGLDDRNPVSAENGRFGPPACSVRRATENTSGEIHLVGAEEGERRKSDAIGLLAIHRESQIRRIQRDFLYLLLEQGEGTSDSISDATPADVRKNCMGAAVRHLLQARLIEFVKFTVSSRPDRHGCPVRVWRILDRGKAIQWLADHPDLPDPGEDRRQGNLF